MSRQLSPEIRIDTTRMSAEGSRRAHRPERVIGIPERRDP